MEILRNRLLLIRVLLAGFMVGLIASGLTAIPLKLETECLVAIFNADTFLGRLMPGMAEWMARAYEGVHETDERYPFILYGMDWLAFGHIVIGLAFIGAIRDPVRNVWIVQWGMLACVLVFPFAMIFGPGRGIPLYWRWIDCSFGFVGIIPLWLAYRLIRQAKPKTLSADWAD
jgi:hypothetical protein